HGWLRSLRAERRHFLVAEGVECAALDRGVFLASQSGPLWRQTVATRQHRDQSQRGGAVEELATRRGRVLQSLESTDSLVVLHGFSRHAYLPQYDAGAGFRRSGQGLSGSRTGPGQRYVTLHLSRM